MCDLDHFPKIQSYIKDHEVLRFFTHRNHQKTASFFPSKLLGGIGAQKYFQNNSESFQQEFLKLLFN